MKEIKIISDGKQLVIISKRDIIIYLNSTLSINRVNRVKEYGIGYPKNIQDNIGLDIHFEAKDYVGLEGEGNFKNVIKKGYTQDSKTKEKLFTKLNKNMKEMILKEGIKWQKQ